MIDVAHWRDVPAAAWRWKDFTPEEMACRSDGSLKIDEGFMDKLQSLRDACGMALPVTSGYRTPEHNAAVSHTGETGPHTTGRAVDLNVFGFKAFRVSTLAATLGFTGIGLNQKGPSTGRILHLDDLPPADGQPRPTIWTY